MVSKRELEERYGLADTTVYRTLKACGLSTAKRHYTEAEIRERFEVARKLFRGGLTFSQVKEYFSMQVAKED